jgi:hypothetical protein
VKAPGRFERALARPGGARGFGCLTVLAIYGAATDQVPWPVPVLLAVLTAAARNARAEVVAYDRWMSAWDVLAGSAPARALAQRKRALPPTIGARRVGFATVVLAGTWFVIRAQQSGVSLGECLVAVFGLALAGRFAIRFIPGLRRLGGARPAQHPREFTVAICPALPAHAPRPNLVGLPPYCRALFAHATDAPPAGPAAPDSPPN